MSSAQHLHPSCFQPAFSSLGRCGMILHPFLSTPCENTVGPSWMRQFQPALSAPTKGSCPKIQRWEHNETRVGISGHVESRHAFKYAGTCPSVRPGRSRPVQEEARWLEKPYLCSMFQCSQVLHGLQQTENCCLLYMPRKTHFSAISPSPIISPFPFGTEGADPSGSKLCTQGLCYVHPTWPFW